MKWASAISENGSLAHAVEQCALSIKNGMAGAPVDFLSVFISEHYAEEYGEAAPLLQRALNPRTLFGCSAGGIIGAGREVEHRPAVSLLAAHLPGVRIKPFFIQDEDIPDLDAPPRAWESAVGAQASENPQFLLLADPFSIHADNFVMGLDYAYPKSPKVGGLASGARGPGENALYLNETCFKSGLIGAAFSGNVMLETLVAQGCRPIGEALQVTGCQDNVLLELNRKPPLEILRAMVENLNARDRDLIQNSLFLGMAMDPSKGAYEQGDFLIRNIIGANMDKGTLAVGARLRPGQTVQFHLRDARTSSEDLRLLLSRTSSSNEKPRGAFLFSCLGRGQGLYGKPDHDSRLFQDSFGPLPLAGFFCNGEIGPVGGTTYLHGYTSCFGLFRPKNPAP